MPSPVPAADAPPADFVAVREALTLIDRKVDELVEHARGQAKPPLTAEEVAAAVGRAPDTVPAAATARPAKDPGFLAGIVSVFNDRLEEAGTEIGDGAAYAAQEADGRAGGDVRDAVAELLAAHADGEAVEPVVPDGERDRPHPVGPDANADATR